MGVKLLIRENTPESAQLILLTQEDGSSLELRIELNPDGRLVSAARLTDKGGDPKLTVTYDKNVE